MRYHSAVYYPHLEVQGKTALKKALMLWDQLNIVVPQGCANRVGRWPDEELAPALDLISKRRPPTDEEQTRAHKLMEDTLANGKFPVAPSENGGNYQLLPAILNDDTLRLLRDRGVTQDEDHPRALNLHREAGLFIMSIMAHVMAGETLALYTDRGESYTALWNSLSQLHTSHDVTASEAMTYIVSVAFSNVNLDDVSLEQLIEYRRREIKESGNSLHELRHKFLDFTDMKAQELTRRMQGKAFTANDLTQFINDMKSDLRKDARSLRKELSVLTVGKLLSKDLIYPIVPATILYSTIELDPTQTYCTSAIGTILTVLPALKEGHSYLKERMEILSKHPTAYTLCLCQKSYLGFKRY